MARRTATLKAIRTSRAKTYYYQVLPIHKKDEPVTTYMVKVSDRQSLQSSTFDCKGDLLLCVSSSLLRDLLEKGTVCTHLVVDFPRNHKTYNVIKKDDTFIIEERKV